MPDNNLYNDIKSGQAANNYSYDAIGNLIADQQEGISTIKWNVYGKIASINKSTGAINYFYDVSGNRVMKQTTTDTVAYVRDASGNVLSVYNKNKNGLVQQSETYLYGSSRLGVVRAQRVAPKIMKLNVSFNDAKLGVFTRGEKLYELSNHLGNILTTVSDKRLPVTKNNDTVVSGYTAVVLSASDYYPFGMEMVGRNYSTYNTYRFGFNGKENDKEIEGQQDYGFRIYDKRLGKFKSVDPLSPKYPELTPYQFASNTPIQAIDLDGAEALFVHGTWSDKTTWGSEFVKNMLKATGWNKIQTNALYGNWSGLNNAKARIEAANSMYNFLTSDKNPYRYLKHTTLIGHSHGGNVDKILGSKLRADGWSVDIVNIETPQRKDFNMGRGGHGVYLNFYSKLDIVQFAGSLGHRWESGARTDYAADKNIELPESIPIITPTRPILFNSIFQWFKDVGGHSLHNNPLSSGIIINQTKKAFEENKKEYPNSGTSTTSDTKQPPIKI